MHICNELTGVELNLIKSWYMHKLFLLQLRIAGSQREFICRLSLLFSLANPLCSKELMEQECIVLCSKKVVKSQIPYGKVR